MLQHRLERSCSCGAILTLENDLFDNVGMDGSTSFFFRCPNCLIQTNLKDTIDEAIEDWNNEIVVEQTDIYDDFEDMNI